MDPARWRAIRDLFDELVELGPADRAARLAAVGRADPVLRVDVERLLASDAAADGLLAPIESALGSEPPEGRGVGAHDPLGLAGRALSHFRVIEPLAVGGMGVVYRAEDTRLHREVALKLPLPLQGVDGRARARFLREARAAGALDHPNVCGIHEVGESEDGHLFLAMALCPGETLKARLERDGALPVPLAVGIARAIARGLGAAHAAGIVHRDVKPGNVMLLPDGGVKVLDFGIASMRDLDAGMSHATAGTISYMAPEQVRGEAVDARTDLWALGVVLYEMLTGRRPFDRAHEGAIGYAVVHEDPVRPLALRAEIPHALDAVVRALLQKDWERRPATADAVDAELAAAGQGPASRLAWTATIALRLRLRRRARRVRTPLAAGALAVTAGVAALLLQQGATRQPAAPSTAGARPTASAEAYDFYVRGREYERRPRSRESLHGARLLYRRALAIDSTFALARARIAIVQVALLRAGYDRDPSILADARAASEAALRSRPELGEGHLARGHIWELEGHRDSALAAYERAAVRMPESPEPHTATALALRGQGRWDEAVARFEQAAALDPRDVGLLQALARTQSRMRRYEAAIRTWNRIVELAPDDHDARIIRGGLYLRWQGSTDTLAAALRAIPAGWDPEGTATWARFSVARIDRRPADALSAVTASRHDASYDDVFYRPRALLQAQAHAARGDRRRAAVQFERARSLLEDSVAAHPEDVRMHVALGLVYAGLGRPARAAAAAHRAMALVQAPAATPIATAVMGDAAEVLVRAGDRDGALALLARLLAMPAGREISAALLRVDPVWDQLRGDERFERMLVEPDVIRADPSRLAKTAPAKR